jgi:hypothetical protein
MREYCPVCDSPMRLLSTDSNAPILLWECCNCQTISLVAGTRLLTLNWGLLFASLKITDLDEYRRCLDEPIESSAV